jgi:hypothetical protein
MLDFNEKNCVINILEINNNMNSLLLNPLNKVHPYLFQFVIIKFFSLIILLENKKLFFNKILLYLKIIIATIFFGS